MISRDLVCSKIYSAYTYYILHALYVGVKSIMISRDLVCSKIYSGYILQMFI